MVQVQDILVESSQFEDVKLLDQIYPHDLAVLPVLPWLMEQTEVGAEGDFVNSCSLIEQTHSYLSSYKEDDLPDFHLYFEALVL